MIEICGILRSPILVLQTPPDFVSSVKIDSLNDFFRSVEIKGVRLAWEIRRHGVKPLPEALVTLMQEHSIVHSVDLSVEEPAINSDIVYTRLFGKGRHNLYQFTDDELTGIIERAERLAGKVSYLTFHGAKMYKDAARIKVFNATGKYPLATGSVGLASVAKVLREDAKFPSDKKKLVEDQGWKVVDLSLENRVHLCEVLTRLPEKEYASVDDVLSCLRGCLDI
jgi:hypothetical protein